MYVLLLLLLVSSTKAGIRISVYAHRQITVGIDYSYFDFVNSPPILSRNWRAVKKGWQEFTGEVVFPATMETNTLILPWVVPITVNSHSTVSGSYTSPFQVTGRQRRNPYYGLGIGVNSTHYKMVSIEDWPMTDICMTGRCIY